MFCDDLIKWRQEHNIKVDGFDTKYLPKDDDEEFHKAPNYMPEHIKNSANLVKWTGLCTDGKIRTYIKISTKKGHKWIVDKHPSHSNVERKVISNAFDKMSKEEQIAFCKAQLSKLVRL